MTAELAGWAVAGAAIAVAAVTARRGRHLDARLQLVAHAAHELRGALGAMALALARVDADTLPAQAWRSSIDALRFQQARAVLAADDLDAARGARTASPVQVRSAVDLESLVRSCVRSWAAAHGQWRVVLDWRAGRPVVYGHPGRLGQALDNLIANALEHGGGPVTVVGRSGPGSARVAVLDRGPGLQRSLHDLRVASWRARRGHGLAVVRRAVEDHGGRMRLVREGRGAGVEVTLPVSPDDSVPARPAAASPAPGRPGLARSG